MKARVFLYMVFVFLLLHFLFSACRTIAGQPTILKAEIIPSEISQGDSAIIQANIKDKHHLIRKVVATVKEDPRIKLELKDDGIEPDKKANDGVWVLKVDVPPEALPGNYTLEITAVDKDDVPVKVRIKKGEIQPLKVEIPITIKNK